jgi:tetratricopeptide (TPR) repeat protein
MSRNWLIFNIRFVLSLAGKFALTLGLLLLLQGLIVEDFHRLQEKWQQSSLTESFQVDPEKVAMKARIKTLNRQMPDFQYLAQIARAPGRFDPVRMKDYVRYYQRVVEYFPSMGEAWGMLGFCYHFYDGKTQQAIEAYEKAIQCNPRFFWFYYNLGSLHYQQGDYAKAVRMLEAAIKQDFAQSAKFILSSQYIYRQTRNALSLNHPRDLKAQFQRGYEDALVLLLQAYDHRKRYSAVVPLAFNLLQMDNVDKERLYFYLSKATFHLQQHKRSIVFVQETLKRNPRNSDAIQYLALNLKALGQDQAALNTLKKMVVLVKSGQESVLQPRVPELQMY